jgi:hypothetical protein
MNGVITSVTLRGVLLRHARLPVSIPTTTYTAIDCVAARDVVASNSVPVM